MTEKCNFKEKKASITQMMQTADWCALTNYNMKCSGEQNCILFKRYKK